MLSKLCGVNSPDNCNFFVELDRLEEIQLYMYIYTRTNSVYE